ncbi:MAG: hypothetical protein AB1758_25575 [Candidatus Eremiobacterota bacterium]
MFKKLLGMFGGGKAPAAEDAVVSRWATMAEADWKDLFAGLVQEKDLEGVYRHMHLCPLHWSVGLLNFLTQSSFQPSDPADQTTYSNLVNLSPAPEWPLMLPAPINVGSLSHRGKGVSMNFSNDGQFLVTVDAGGDANLWHAPDERLVTKIRPDVTVPVDARTVTPDFKYLTTSANDAIRVWNLRTGEIISKFRWEWPDGTSPAIVSSPTQNVIACWFSDAKVRLIEPLSGEIRHTMEGHEDTVMSCAFTGDGKLLVTGSKDASVRIWDVETGQMLHLLEKRLGGEAVTHIAISPDGKYMLIKRERSPLQIWDPATRRHIKDIATGRGVDLGTLVFSPSHDAVCAVWVRAQEEKETQMKVAIYSLETGTSFRDLPPTYLNFPAPAFSFDGMYLAATGADEVVLWPTRGQGQDAFLKREAWACAFAPNGLMMATGERDKHTRLWSLPEGNLMVDLGAWQHSRYLSFSPDSGILAAVGDDRSVRMHRVSMTQPIALMGKRELEMAKKNAAAVPGEAGKAWAYLGELLGARLRKNLN